MQYFELIELAGTILGLPSDKLSERSITNGLLRKFNVDFDTFCMIAEALSKLTIPQQSKLSGNFFQGFVNLKEQRFIVKQLYFPKDV